MNQSRLELVYVKLGGSLITVKSKPVTVKSEALDTVVKALRRVYGRVGLVLGNGGGSFAHYAVRRYCNGDPAICISKCHQSTRLLNRLIVDYLVSSGIPASSVQTSAFITVKPGGGFQVFYEPVASLLSLNVIPVVYGECLPSDEGPVVISTEEVFGLLAEVLKPSRIVLLTDVKGIYTCNPSKCSNPELVRRIDKSNLSLILDNLREEAKADVTGSIYGKIESMSRLSSKLGVRVIMTSGFNADEVVSAILKGEVGEGTVIEV
ncbi:MAG: isopentenyl phosphate kinase [Desulfurococcus sp.]|nr:isopentenyl phosphate kinase [Desulfurococcus sp.]